jgi:hypothetical protein
MLWHLYIYRISHQYKNILKADYEYIFLPLPTHSHIFHIYCCLKCKLLSSHPSSSPDVSAIYGHHQVSSILLKLLHCTSKSHCLWTQYFLIKINSSDILVVVVHSFIKYLLQYLLFWAYLRIIPSAAWVLCMLLVWNIRCSCSVISLVMYAPLAVAPSMMPE